MSNSKKKSKKRPNSKLLADELRALPEDQMESRLLEIREEDPVLSGRVMGYLGLDWEEPEEEEEPFQLEQEQEVIKGVNETDKAFIQTVEAILDVQNIRGPQQLAATPTEQDIPDQEQKGVETLEVPEDIPDRVYPEASVLGVASAVDEQQSKDSEQDLDQQLVNHLGESKDTSDRRRRRKNFLRNRPDKSRYSKRFSR